MTSTSMNNNPTYSEWLASLSPEDRKKFRDAQNARMRKFYQENLAIKVKCSWCGAVVCQGSLRRHEQSKKCQQHIKAYSDDSDDSD